VAWDGNHLHYYEHEQKIFNPGFLRCLVGGGVASAFDTYTVKYYYVMCRISVRRLKARPVLTAARADGCAGAQRQVVRRM